MVDGTLAADGGKEIFYTLASGATGITDLSVIESAIRTDAAAQAKWGEIKAYIDNVSAKIKDGSIKVTNAQIGERLNISTLSNIKLP